MIENLNGFVYKRVSKLKDTQKMELNGFVFNVIKKRKSSVTTKPLINTKITDEENLKNENLKNENVNPNIRTMHQPKITDLLHIPENSIISPKIRFDESILHKPVDSSICPHSTVKFDIKTINPPKSTKKPRPSFIESINRPSRPKPIIKIDPDLFLDSKVNSLLSQLITQNNYDIKFEPVKITNPYDELITDYEQAIEDVRIEIEGLEKEIVKWNLLYEKVKKENEIDVPEMKECVVKCEYKNECKYKNVMNEMGDKIRAMKEEIAGRTVNLKDRVVKRYGNTQSVDPVLLLKKMSEM